jgi:hypothetical protein
VTAERIPFIERFFNVSPVDEDQSVGTVFDVIKVGGIQAGGTIGQNRRSAKVIRLMRESNTPGTGYSNKQGKDQGEYNPFPERAHFIWFRSIFSLIYIKSI